jgi:hypothetical protein
MMFLKAVSAARRTYPVITDGLKLYLDAYNIRSYPGTGTTWTDLSNSSYDFTNSGSTWAVSSGRRYFELDGVNDYLYGNSNTTLFNITSTGYTVSIWLLHVTAPAAFDRIIMPEYGTAQVLPFFMDNTNTSGTTGNGWRFGAYNNGGAQTKAAYYNQTVTTNVWRHMVGTFEHLSTTTATIKLYQNGSLVSTATTANSTTASGYTWSDFNDTKAPYVGVLNNNGTLSQFNNIRVGEILYYNRPLTATEVSNNYNSTKSNYGL